MHRAKAQSQLSVNNNFTLFCNLFFVVFIITRVGLILNPEDKLDSTVELVVSIVEGINFLSTIAINVHYINWGCRSP